MFDQKYTSTLGFAGVLCGSLIVALDAVALSPSLPTIQLALNASTTETYWAGVAYTLGSATFLPLFPAASNIVGRRLVTLAALLLFLVGTIVCSSAHDVASMLAGRVLQGIGSGGIIGMMYVVMTDLFELTIRAKAIALNGLIWLLGTTLGPIMGGGFSESASWRWIFWIALPINVIALILVALFLEIPQSSPRSVETAPDMEVSHSFVTTSSWRRIDFFGAVLLVASLSSFLIAVTWGGVNYSWTAFQTLTPLLLGLGGIGFWIAYELFAASDPLIPLKVLGERTVGISLLQTFVIGVIQFGVVFYLPLYYQVVKGYTPLISGVALLPVALVSGPVTMATGNLIAKTGKYKSIILVGWVFMALGTGLSVLLEQKTTIAEWIFITAPIGVGTGILFAATTVSVQAPVKQENAAVVSGLIGFFRSIGQAIGIACGNTITLNVVQRKLRDSSISALRDRAKIIADNVSSPTAISSLIQDVEAKDEIMRAYVDGLRGIWWLLFGLACCCAISTLFIQDISMQQNESAQQVQTSTESLYESQQDEKTGGQVGSRSITSQAGNSV